MKHLVINLLFLSITSILLSSCANISMLNQNYYTPEFLAKIESIQLIYKDGDKQSALMKLRGISDEGLRRDELAKKYNLLGIMYFSQSDINTAIENFQKAKNFIDKDRYLSSQISLNLASSYLRNDHLDVAKPVLKSINPEYFSDKEKEKYWKLKFAIASKNQNNKEVVYSLMNLTKGLDTFSEVEYFQYKEVLIDNYKQLSDSERVYVIDKFESENKIVSAYLGKTEVTLRFYSGDKSGAQDVVDWLEQNFIEIPEVKAFVEDFKYRVENFSKISSGNIGVVVPLSGRFAKYGQNALRGINSAMAINSEKSKSLKLFVKNNQNNKFLSKSLIQELIFKHKASVIIGGLFPDLAKEEYLEAKKYGVMFISLSPIYIPRSQKDHLLIEISGSVESQLDVLLSDKNLERLGKNVAIFYPETEKGRGYVDEFWRFQSNQTINISNLNSYKKGVTQYLEPVKQLLFLNNPRERSEELKIWKDIRELEKTNVRVINELPPIIDFEWVFLPAVPSEALQIISSFTYYDAKNIKFIGGPSWNNNKLVKERRSLGEMLFIGNDTSDVQFQFAKKFASHNKGKRPHLVDTLSYESTLLVIELLANQKFEKRDDLEKRVLSFKELKGLTSKWTNSNGIWIKDMNLLKITRRGIKKLEEE